ncbi:MAG: tRNA dihydrouridine synthase DusB [bacterium]|nr:tRNA dihydrouridine synthase DusB [bacterium]
MNWNDLPRPIVALAPMADMTDLPFCLICKEKGAPIMFREMVSSEAIIRMSPKTLKMCEFDERERPIVQQIFGADPNTMAKAARIIEEKFKPDAIDINMGCPVYNIVSKFNGASLIREPKRAGEIVRKMKSAVSVPVSVKTRLGWDDDRQILDFVKVLEDAGADLISIHGRTKAQGYSGTANWERIGEAKRNTTLPILVNGDIVDLETAKIALDQSGADGMLIARGALGNPWIFQRIINGLEKGIDPEEPSMQERFDTIRKHAQLQVDHFGEKGLIKLRKHLPWYFKGMSGIKDFRSKLVRISTVQELEEALASSNLEL